MAVSHSRRTLLVGAFLTLLVAGGVRLSANERRSSRTLLAGSRGAPGARAYLDELGREGLFAWQEGDLSTFVAADEQQAVFVPPNAGPSGASGAWVRIVEDGILRIGWFGAAGDGRQSDLPALRAAVELMRRDMRYRQLHFDGDKRYLLHGFRRARDIHLNFSNVVIDGRGAELVIEPQIPNRAVFVVGNDRYATGLNEEIPENITVRGFRVDLVQNAAFFKFIFLRYPARGVLIEDNQAYQSRLGDRTPSAGGDCNLVNLFVIQSAQGGGAKGNPGDAKARLHDVTIRRNVVRNRIQLTADAGRGVAGLTITDNEAHDPRANGIAVTGIGPVTRLDNVLIARNKVYRATGRGIFVQNDGISDVYDMDVAGISNYQNYARNVSITDNLLQDCKEGIRTGAYIQGFHGLVIDNNIVQSASQDDGASSLRIQPNSYGWARQYHGGANPVVPADAFDPAAGLVSLPGHSLCNACGVRIKPVSGAEVMPPGLSADIPYFVKPAGPDRFELFRTIDPVTGKLSGKVLFGPGASGSFTVAMCSIATDVRIGAGNVFVATNSGFSVLSDIRGAQVSGRMTGRLNLGGLVDMVIGGAFANARLVINRGGVERLVFRGTRFTGRLGGNGSPSIIRAAFGETAHYDVSLEGVEADLEAGLNPQREGSFYSEAPEIDSARRKGPGWSARNSIVRISGTGRIDAFAASPRNNAAFVANEVSVP